MAKLLSKSLVPCAGTHPPEHIVRSSASGARRMLAKLGELHQPLHLHTQRGIQVQHRAVHGMTDLVSGGLRPCWKSPCCTEEGLG
jgi:hypothetical protein